MCDSSDASDVWRQDWRKARIEHVCTGCHETISPGHHYQSTASLFDGHWTTWKHCRRCDDLFTAIADAHRKTSGEYVVYIDPQFNCGESWVDNFGDLPDPVAALAFALPGEDISK